MIYLILINAGLSLVPNIFITITVGIGSLMMWNLSAAVLLVNALLVLCLNTWPNDGKSWTLTAMPIIMIHLTALIDMMRPSFKCMIGCLERGSAGVPGNAMNENYAHLDVMLIKLLGTLRSGLASVFVFCCGAASLIYIGCGHIILHAASNFALFSALFQVFNR